MKLVVNGNYLMVDDYMLDKLLYKIKEIIGFKNSFDTKILIETDGKLRDDIILEYIVILTSCVIKDGDKLRPQLFLEETLVA